MFSVVIPLYNKEKSIQNTINSVLAQEFKEFEVVIVNDGSTDNSLERVMAFKDERIRIINQENGGVSWARNKGIEEAKYKWIAFLDGDDVWEPHHLKTINRAILKYPNDKVFCCSFVRSDQVKPKNEENSIMIIENYFEEARKYHFFWTSVSVIHNSVFDAVGIFKGNLSRGEDLELWARIGKKYRFIKSNITTAIYVQDSDNKLSFTNTELSNSFINYIDFKGIKDSERKYFKQLIINKLKSLALKGDIMAIIKLVYRYNLNLI